MAQSFIEQEIPIDFQEIYRRRLSEGKDDTLEGELLSVADKIDLLYESYEEITKSNPDDVFNKISFEAIITLKYLGYLLSVRYLFQEIFQITDKISYKVV